LTVAVTEEKIQEVFEEYGKVERVKKIKDYAFVHFEDRDKATEAMRGLHRKDLMGAELDVSLAKPPSDKKKKEEMLRKREQRMMRAITTNDVAFRLSSMSMALPPFTAPYPAAFPFAAGLGGGIYPGAAVRGGGGRGGHQGQSGGRGHNGVNGNWHSQWNGGPGGHAVNGGWAGDSSWHHHQRGPPVPWMAAAGAEAWGHPRSGGNNFNWGGANGAASSNGGGNRGHRNGGKSYGTSR